MPRINFETTYSINQSSLKQVQDSLKSLQKLTVLDLDSSKTSGLSKAKEDLKEIKITASKVETALEKAFNPKLNSLNTETFNKSLKEADLTIKDVYTTFSKAGGKGEAAFAQLGNSVLKTNIQLKQSHKLLDEIAQTLTNTIKWNLASSAVNQLSRTIQQAVGYAKALDSSLNDIRIVTNQSAEEMNTFAKSANQAAVNLGRSTTDYTDAALIYYQQGLNAEETAARAEVTLKAANVTGQTGQQVSEQLTAVWNGYKVSAEEAELYVDRLAAVAASTASDLEELSTGMSKVAASANAMGVSEEQLASQLATIISVTRQAPESVGTALKTIYSRMSDIKAGIAEDDITLGEYSGKLASMGINVLDANNQLRDMGEVMEEVGSKWETFSREQQVAIAQIMGGARQYTMLTALFENWGDYTKTMEVAANAQGTLQQQQEIYMESTRAHIEQLNATMEGLYSSLIDSDSIIAVVDALKTVAEITSNWVDAMGGGVGVLKQLGSIGLIVFNKQISEGLLKTIDNLKLANQNAQRLQETFELNKDFQNAVSKSDTLNTEATALKEKLLQNGMAENLDSKEFEKIQSLLEKYVDVGVKLVEQEQSYKEIDQLFKNMTGSANDYADEVKNVLDRPDADKFLSSLTEIENKLKKVQEALKESKKSYDDFLSLSLEALRSKDNTEERIKEIEENIVNSIFKIEDGFKSLDDYKDWADKLLGPDVVKKIDNLQTRFNNAFNEMAGSDDEETQARLRTIIANIRKEFSQLIGDIKQKATEAKESVERDMQDGVSYNQQSLEEIKKEHERALTAIEREWQESTLRIKIQSITSLIGSITGIASTLESLADIVASDDLDIGKKLTRSLSLIPNMIMYLGSLNKTLNFVKISADAVTLSEAGFATQVTLGKNSVIGFNTALLSSPITWVIVALTAGITAFAAFANIVKKNEEALEEERKATIENANAKREELQVLKDLTKTYEESYQGYKKGTSSKQEMLDATRAICEELDIENYEVKLLAGQYEQLAEEIEKANAKKREEALTASVEGYNAAVDAFDKGVYNSKKYVTDNGGKSGFGNTIYFNVQNEEAVKFADELVSSFREVGIEADRAGEKILLFNMDSEQALQAYKVLNEVQGELATHKDWGFDSSNLDSFKESAPEVIEQLNGIKSGVESIFLAEMQGTEAGTAEEFAKTQEEAIQKLKDAYENNGISWEKVFGSEEELEEYAIGLLSKIDSLEEQASIAATKRIAEKNLVNIGLENTDFLDEYDEETIQIIASMEFDEGQTQESVEKQIQLAQEIADVNSLHLNLAPVNDAISELKDKDNLEDFESIQQLQSLLEGLTAEQKEYANAWEEFQSLSESGSLKQIEYLQDLNEIRSEGNIKALQEAEELYNKYNLELQRLQQKREDLLDQLKIPGIDTTEVQKDIQEIDEQIYQLTQAKKQLDHQFDNNLKVNVEMESVAEILDMGDQFISQAQKMQEAAELIGEGFKVAAKDAEALFNIFPELADQASILADGTIQLNQGVVQQLLGDQSQILQGDADAKIAQIDNEIAILEAKKESAEAQLQLAQKLAEGELDLSEAEIEKISGGQEALTQYLMDLGADEVAANKAAAEAMAGNMDEYNRIVGNISNETANNLAQAISDATTNIGVNSETAQKSIQNIGIMAAKTGASIRAMGNGESVEPGDIIGAAAGKISSITNKVASQHSFQGIEAQKTTASKPNIDKWISDLQLDISSYTKGIAQLNALKLKILSTQASAQNAMNNAAAGLGGTYKPSSSSNKGSSGNKDKADKEEKAKESDYIDLLEDEWDIYHDIDIQIDKISRELDRVSKAQSKLAGKDLINNLNKQLDILEKQKQAYQDKIELAKQEAGAYKEALKGFGVTFDNNGQISNYALALQKQLEATNDVIGRYNSLAADQQTEAEKEKVEAAKQQYETLKELIKNYEELINQTIPDLEDDITDALDKQIEIQISKFKMSVDLRLNMTEAEKDWNSFKKKIIDKVKEDDILGNAKADYADILAYYNTAGSGTGSIQALTSQINNTLSQLREMDNNMDKTSSVYGQNRAQAMEDLKKYMDELMSQLSSVQDLVDSIEESYIDMIDEANSKFDEHLNGYKFIDDLIEHNKNVIGLLYGEDAYSELDKFYKRQEENNNKNLDFLRKEADFWLQKMQAEEEGSDAWKAYKENWEDAIKDLNSSIEDSIQIIIDKYSNLINKVFDDLNKKVTDGMGLDYVNDEWDLIKKNADEYLDTINASFAIDKLRGKFQDALNNTDGLQNQKRLNDLMQQQLGDLETREKLTQYDVDRAEKLLDIEIKRIALQDAQKNKSKMRLKRDASGNYSYQFVSDEESIVQAQQDLADAQNSLYNFDKNAYQENLNGIYDIYSEFQNKLMELYADQTLKEEEREAKKALLIEQYQELLTAKTEQNTQIRNNLEDSAFQELAKMYGVNVNEFQNMVDEQKNILLGDLIPGWNDGIQQMIDKFASEGGLIPVCSDAFKELEEVTDKYKDSLKDVQDVGGISFDNLANGYDKNIDLANRLQEENQELINQYDQQIMAIQRVMQEVQNLANMYEVAYKNAVNASKAAYLYWQEQNKQDAANSANKGGGAGSSSTNGGSGSSSSGSTTGNAGAGSTTSGGTGTSGSGGSSASPGKSVTVDNIKVGDKLKYTGGLYYYDSWGSGPTGDRGAGNTVTVSNIAKGNKYPISVTSANSAYGWLLPSQLQKLKTGGYTGEWGPSGKLAMLHEKELVLNASDTKNMLDAVSVVRSITDSFSNNVFNMLGTFSGNAQNILDALNPGANSINNTTINAEFPNVTNHNEIEEAIKNLSNIASQRAMKKR